jgi:hypothetical protein
MQASQTRWTRACALPYRCIRRMSLAGGFQSLYDFKFFTIRARRLRILIAVEDTRQIMVCGAVSLVLQERQVTCANAHKASKPRADVQVVKAIGIVLGVPLLHTENRIRLMVEHCFPAVCMVVM